MFGPQLSESHDVPEHACLQNRAMRMVEQKVYSLIGGLIPILSSPIVLSQLLTIIRNRMCGFLRDYCHKCSLSLSVNLLQSYETSVHAALELKNSHRAPGQQSAKH